MLGIGASRRAPRATWGGLQERRLGPGELRVAEVASATTSSKSASSKMPDTQVGSGGLA